MISQWMRATRRRREASRSRMPKRCDGRPKGACLRGRIVRPNGSPRAETACEPTSCVALAAERASGASGNRDAKVLKKRLKSERDSEMENEIKKPNYNGGHRLSAPRGDRNRNR